MDFRAEPTVRLRNPSADDVLYRHLAELLHARFQEPCGDFVDLEEPFRVRVAPHVASRDRLRQFRRLSCRLHGGFIFLKGNIILINAIVSINCKIAFDE